MLTCRSRVNFCAQGDFNSARSRAALRLLGLLLKLSQAESTLMQPTVVDSRTCSALTAFGPDAISRSICASSALPMARIRRRVLPKEIPLGCRVDQESGRATQT